MKPHNIKAQYEHSSWTQPTVFSRESHLNKSKQRSLTKKKMTSNNWQKKNWFVCLRLGGRDNHPAGNPIGKPPTWWTEGTAKRRKKDADWFRTSGLRETRVKGIAFPNRFEGTVSMCIWTGVLGERRNGTIPTIGFTRSGINCGDRWFAMRRRWSGMGRSDGSGVCVDVGVHV